MVTVACAPPRVRVVPESAVDWSVADRAVEWAREHGMNLDPWQEDALHLSLGLRADGTWACKEFGLNVPRQNGKGEVLMARQAFGLFELGERDVIHTAHEFRTSQEHFRRVEGFVRANDDLLALVRRGRGSEIPGFSHSHGDAKIELQDMRRLMFATRTKGGSRGFTGECVAFDEAMIFTRAAHAAQMPIVRARSMATEGYPRGMQLWYMGSAVDEEVHEHGLVWTAVRKRALEGNDPWLGYLEWSVDCDHPDELTEEMALDEELRRQATPAYGVRIAPEHMDFEYRAMDLRSFGVELLGVGAYPSLDAAADQIIPYEAWMALADLSDPPPPIVGDAYVGFDVSPERKGAVAVAGYGEDGRLQVEVPAHRQGTGWIPKRLVEITGRWDVADVVCDGYGPVRSVGFAVEEEGVKLRRITAGELGEACGLLVDLVKEQRVRHLGSEALSSAVRGAKPRPLGDSWAWSRKSSSVDISPLVAATLALWAAAQNPPGGEMVIW